MNIFSVTFLEVMLALNQLEADVYGVKGIESHLYYNADPKIVVFERSSLCFRHLAVTDHFFNLSQIFLLLFKLIGL